jgi:hypothetical protein
MTELTSHQQQGLDRTRNYFYLTLASLASSILANIIQFPYLVEILKFNRRFAEVISNGIQSNSDGYMRSINSLNSSSDLLAIQSRYGALIGIGSLLGLVGFGTAIAGIVFLALAISKYYRYYANQADNVSRNTVSGAVWGVYSFQFLTSGDHSSIFLKDWTMKTSIDSTQR